MVRYYYIALYKIDYFKVHDQLYELDIQTRAEKKSSIRKININVFF